MRINLKKFNDQCDIKKNRSRKFSILENKILLFPSIYIARILSVKL